jgi:hypothetical protein
LCTIVPSIITNCTKYNIAEEQMTLEAYQESLEKGMTSEELSKLFNKR